MRQRRKQPYAPSLDALNVNIGRQWANLLEAHTEYQREMIRAYAQGICRKIAESLAGCAVDGIFGKGGVSGNAGPIPRNRWW